MGGRKHGLLNAASTAPCYFVNPIAVAATESSNYRTDLGSKKIGVNKCVPPRIQKFLRHMAGKIRSEGIQLKGQGLENWKINSKRNFFCI